MDKHLKASEVAEKLYVEFFRGHKPGYRKNLLNALNDLETTKKKK